MGGTNRYGTNTCHHNKKYKPNIKPVVFILGLFKVMDIVIKLFNNTFDIL